MPTSPEQWILVGHVSVLVTQDCFEQVQAKLKTNQQFARRNNRAHAYLLRALVSCGYCQLACTGQTHIRYSYYTCVGKSHPSCSGREQKCHNRLIPMRQLDLVVWADLCDLLAHPETIRQRPPHNILYVDGHSGVANPLAILTAISYTTKEHVLQAYSLRRSHELLDPGEYLSCNIRKGPGDVPGVGGRNYAHH